MSVKVSGHHIVITPALKEYVVGKLDRINHHLDDVTKMEVVLTVEKLRNMAKGNVSVRGELLHAEAEAQDMYAAIDELADKLHRQALKHKENMQKHD